jgi:CheY-specific phosphatase CheX/anti-anti-sigma regulatory factor
MAAFTAGNSEFGFYSQAGYNLVKAAGDLDRDSYAAFLAEFDETETAQPQHYLFDFGALTEIGSYWGRALIQTKEKLKAAGGGRCLKIINAGPGIVSCLKAQGLEDAVPRSASLETAHAELGLKRSGTLDTNVIIPFVNGVITAIGTVKKTSSRKQTLFTQEGGAPLLGDVSALVQLESPSFRGVFVLSFPRATILRLVSQLTGEPAGELTSLVQSAVGEFGNLAVTTGKKTLNELGYGLKCQLPVVTMEKSLPAGLENPAFKSLVVPFETEHGQYFIDVRFV